VERLQLGQRLERPRVGNLGDRQPKRALVGLQVAVAFTRSFLAAGVVVASNVALLLFRHHSPP